MVPVLDANGNPIPRAGEIVHRALHQLVRRQRQSEGSVFTDTFNITWRRFERHDVPSHNNDHIVFGPVNPFDPDTLVKVTFEKANCG